MQGFQACAHVQCYQDESAKNPEMEQNTSGIKKVDLTQPEEAHKSKHILMHDTSRIELLDTGSIFNLTNNRETLTNSVKAAQPITSRTNVRQQQMMTHGKILDLTEEMWLDEMSMIMIIGFAKLAERHRIQCNDWNGASF